MFLFSCGSKEKQAPNDLDQFGWLLGSWMDSTSDGKMVEIWNQINDSAYVGSSIYMAGADTIFFEEISLRKVNGKIYYVPSIQSQNDGLPVFFAMTSSKKGEYVFENKKHDFPKKIVYTNPSDDSLIAYIEGPTEKGMHKEFFKLQRVR
jgi:hypothetical protein